MVQRIRNPHFRVRYASAARFVWLARSAEPFASTEDIDVAVSEITRVLDSLGRRTFVMLLDLREAPMRTDPAFDKAMRGQLPRIFADISQVALLVSTSLGALQVARHMREQGWPWKVHSSEREALASLGQSALPTA